MPLIKALGFALWIATGSATEVRPGLKPGLLHFSGNLLMPDEVYAAVLNLPSDTRPTPATARSIERTLTMFLRRSGFELASVSAVSTGKNIEIAIDEGRLDKVIFRGRLTLTTLRFKLGLRIDYDIFNRPALTQEMAKLAESLNIDRVWFELVPTKNVEHAGFQLEQLGQIEGLSFVHPQQPFALHIFFEEKDWDTGLGVDLRSTYLDGLEVEPSFQGAGTLLHGDRWRTAASVGINVRQRIGDDRLYPSFTRLSAEARWFSPTQIFFTRPFVWLRTELVDRQRRDVGLESYFGSFSEASVGLWGKSFERLELMLGGGGHHRRIFDLRPGTGIQLPPDIGTYRRFLAFVMLRLNALLDDEDQRADRAHALKLELKQYSPVSNDWFGYGAYRYQYIIPWGWHDLWFKSRGKWVWGRFQFNDEEPVGEYLYGLLATDYAARIGSVGGEFRFSITRDILKLSAFYSLAVFQQLDRTSGIPTRTVRAANAFGPGLHLLIESMFQLDMYMAFGFRSDGRFDTGLAALLDKVF